MAESDAPTAYHYTPTFAWLGTTPEIRARSIDTVDHWRPRLFLADGIRSHVAAFMREAYTSLIQRASSDRSGLLREIQQLPNDDQLVETRIIRRIMEAAIARVATMPLHAVSAEPDLQHITPHSSTPDDSLAPLHAALTEEVRIAQQTIICEWINLLLEVHHERGALAPMRLSSRFLPFGPLVEGVAGVEDHAAFQTLCTRILPRVALTHTALHGIFMEMTALMGSTFREDQLERLYIFDAGTSRLVLARDETTWMLLPAPNPYVTKMIATLEEALKRLQAIKAQCVSGALEHHLAMITGDEHEGFGDALISEAYSVDARTKTLEHLVNAVLAHDPEHADTATSETGSPEPSSFSAA